MKTAHGNRCFVRLHAYAMVMKDDVDDGDENGDDDGGDGDVDDDGGDDSDDGDDGGLNAKTLTL